LSLKLIFIFVFRNIKEEKLFSLISIFGVALGVGLFVSILTSTNMAIENFGEDIKRLNPKAELEIVPVSGNFLDEKIYETLIKNQIRPFPVIKVNALYEKTDTNIYLFGVEPLKAFKFLDIDIDKNGIDLKLFLTDLKGVILTEDIANRFNIKKGETFNLLVNNRKYNFTVAGILKSDLIPTGIYQDIGNFQERLGYVGVLSRIDLQEYNIQKLREILPKDVEVIEKSKAVSGQKELLASFKYNLHFISFIAILVGFFMLYNTIFITVVKKRTQIGILRALGANRLQILLIFLSQSIILGVVGALIGVFIGQFFSIYASHMVEDTVSTIFQPILLKEVSTFQKYSLTAFLMGIFISVIAGALPAIEASKIKPTEVSRSGTFEYRYKSFYKLAFFVGIVFVILGSIVSFLDFLKSLELPVFSYFGVFLILLGFALSTPFYLESFVKKISRKIKKYCKTCGAISISDISSNIFRFSIALISVAISTALIVSMAILINSFENSLRKWIDRHLVADIFIKSSSCSSNFCFEALDSSILEKIKSVKGVEDINPFRAIPIRYRDKNTILGFSDEKIVKKYENGISSYEITKSVAVSEYFKIKYNLKEGDNITIKTPKGDETFFIREIFTSYSTTNGIILMDKSFQEKFWGTNDFTQLSIFLKKGYRTDDIIEQIKEKLGGNLLLDIYDNNVLKKKVLNIFDKTFQITYAIQIIALIISLLGVANMLYAVALEKRREISILKYLGADNFLLLKIFIVSSSIIGLAGIFYGLLLGGMLSFIIVKIVNTVSFGWSITFYIKSVKLFFTLFILFLFVILSGCLPIKTIKQTDPKRYISYE
jgi:putative ABC transport system permease protein